MEYKIKHSTSYKIGEFKKFEERKVKDLCAPWKATSVVELQLHVLTTSLGREEIKN
jgi:hypothetical protein